MLSHKMGMLRLLQTAQSPASPPAVAIVKHGSALAFATLLLLANPAVLVSGGRCEPPATRCCSRSLACCCGGTEECSCTMAPENHREATQPVLSQHHGEDNRRVCGRSANASSWPGAPAPTLGALVAVRSACPAPVSVCEHFVLRC